jgi:hypothetical protein
MIGNQKFEARIFFPSIDNAMMPRFFGNYNCPIIA